MKYNRKENINSIIVKSIAIISGIYGLFKTIYSIDSFTYFTVLSNILIIVVLFIFLMIDIKCYLTKKKRKVSNKLYVVKFFSTISITLTFLVFMFLLAPSFNGGLISAYLWCDGGSLCLHFITPLLAIVDFLAFDYDYKEEKYDAYYAIIPPLIYSVFIVILGQTGYRWGTMTAPYNFLNYSSQSGWFGFNPHLAADTTGIGVAYSMLLLSIIFTLIGKLFLYLKYKRLCLKK